MTTLESLSFGIDDLDVRVRAYELNSPKITHARAFDFLDSLGVCVRLVDTTGDYGSWTNVKACMDALGLKHFRTAAPVPGGQGITAMRAAASQGYKFTFTVRNVGTHTYSDELPVIAGIDGDYPGSVVAVEGLNEVSGSPPAGYASFAAYQTALYTDVAARWPVLGYTGSPWTDSASDVANIHHYPRNGDAVKAKFEDFAGTSYARGVGKFMAVTECGFPNSTTSTPFAGTDDATQARLVLNAVCESVYAGLYRLFIYQLLDPFAPTTSTESYFGLFAHPYTIKPAGTALANFVDLILDNASDAATHSNLPIRVTSTGTSHFWTSFSDASGGTTVLLWQRGDIWNQTTKTPISLAPLTVPITVGGGFSSIEWYDPMVSIWPQGTSSSASFDLTLGDSPIVLKITP